MKTNEKVPGNELATREGVNRPDLSSLNLSELVQNMAEGMKREAFELTARIKKAAEAEAANLIAEAEARAREIEGRAQRELQTARDDKDKASAVLQEARQKAISIEAEITKETAQVRIRLKEEIDQHLSEVLDKVRKDLIPSLDQLVSKAQTLEEEFAGIAPKPEDTSCPAPVRPPPAPQEEHESARELHSGLGEALVSGDAPVAEPPFCEEPVIVQPQAEPVVAGNKDADLIEGKAEIHVAPPISIARLLGVTRCLENTQYVKVLQTSGSWSLGSVITVSLEKPLPLLSILRDVPNVAEANMAKNKKGQNGCRLELVLNGNEKRQGGKDDGGVEAS